MDLKKVYLLDKHYDICSDPINGNMKETVICRIDRVLILLTNGGKTMQTCRA